MDPRKTLPIVQIGASQPEDKKDAAPQAEPTAPQTQLAAPQTQLAAAQTEPAAQKTSVHVAPTGSSHAPDAGAAEPTILLVGNPNVGKSTLFNALTGAKQAVVNAPGTTVEVMVGRWQKAEARLLDLPGTYSLVAHSPDEQLVVDTLAGIPGSFTDAADGRSVDLVVCVLDATAITRSLYLLAQVAKTGRPVVAILTLQDIAEAEGEGVNQSKLEEVLGIPVITVDPRNTKDLEAVEALLEVGLSTRPRVKNIAPDPTAPGYNQVAAAAALATECCETPPHLAGDVPCHCDETGVCAHHPPDATASVTIQGPAEKAAEIFTWVDQVDEALGGKETGEPTLSRSDRIDRVLLNPFIGLPVFVALMWFLFKVSGEWIVPLQDVIEEFFGSTEAGAFSVANWLNSGLALVGLEGTWVDGLLVGGILAGIGVLASFVPLMYIIFFMISVLEDSGYMARAAFLGDRLMRKLGLDGRVILPLIMGFGCNLPSLAAARALPSERQRIVTVLITPYTSCAARLTIYLMIARIFFPNHTGTVVFGLYMASILMVVLGALALKPFFTKDEGNAPLMLVLPPYGMPRVLATAHKTWMRTWAFVKGAGKIIVVMTAVVWVLGAIPTTSGYSFADPELPMEESVYGKTAEVISPVFAPAGFNDWHMTGALMTGFVAKETVISSIVVSYNMDEAAAGDAEDGGEDLGDLPPLVRDTFHKTAGDAAPIAALAFLVFVLTYTPCLATVAEQVRQIGGRLTSIAVVVQLVVAWLLAVGVFQVGRMFL